MSYASRKVRERGGATMRNLILRTVAVSGALAVAAIAPKSIALLRKFDRAASRRTELARRISQATAKLHKEGLLEIAGDGKARLTEKGEAHVAAMYVREYQIPEQAFWDGKWRIVMFDMREKRRRARGRLRSLLQSTGFVRLQDSVWVYPYSCDEFITLLRSHLKSGTGEILSITAEAIENDRALRDHFRLP